MEIAGLLGKVLDGKYHLARVIGEGGMATVCEAEELLLGRRVAIKLLHRRHVANEKLLARFHREARIVASIDHANIAEVFETGVTSTGIPYIVMEYLGGESLDEVVRRESPLSPGRAAHITAQILSALQAAHDAQVIHRDIKPHNIHLVEDAGRREVVKLLDFGISKLLQRDTGGVSPLTDTGTTLGTPGYMSPEQALGAKNISKASDIYSVGVVLYQMVTGRLPFDASNRNALMIKLLVEALPDPASLNPAIPDELAAIIRTALARNPTRRFSNCSEFRSRLLPIVASIQSGSDAEAKGSEAALVTDREPRVKRVCDAVFIGLWPSSVDLQLADGDRLRILSLDDVEQLPSVLEDSFPHVIVSSVSIDFSALERKSSPFRTPVITIDVAETDGELAIHEWSEEKQRRIIRRAPFTDLDAEVNELCRHAKAVAVSEDITRIGFSNDVEVAGETLNIETEVAVRNGIQIRTKTWCGGAIVGDVVQVLSPSGEDVSGQVREAVQKQHEAAIERACGTRRSTPA